MDALEQLRSRVRTRKALPSPAVRKAVRLAAGVSQQDIAAVVGVDRASVSRWESGTRQPRGDDLSAYIRVLNELRAS